MRRLETRGSCGGELDERPGTYEPAKGGTSASKDRVEAKGRMILPEPALEAMSPTAARDRSRRQSPWHPLLKPAPSPCRGHTIVAEEQPTPVMSIVLDAARDITLDMEQSLDPAFSAQLTSHMAD